MIKYLEQRLLAQTKSVWQLISWQLLNLNRVWVTEQLHATLAPSEDLPSYLKLHVPEKIFETKRNETKRNENI